MIIDCHGHYTTAPGRTAEVSRRADRRTRRHRSHVPSRRRLNISDDQIRESLEGAQLKFQRERGTDVTIFSPRASAMAHHIGTETTSLHWTRALQRPDPSRLRALSREFRGRVPVAAIAGRRRQQRRAELERCVKNSASSAAI